MGGMGGHEQSMSDMLEQGGNMMSGLEVGLMPMNLDLDLDLNDSDPQNYNGNNQLSQQQPQQHQENDQNDGQQDTQMTGAGAGPLPTGFGTQGPTNCGSTLTEFTKRRNWSQRVLDEIKDLLHILTPDGRILYVSPSGKYLTGYECSDLVGKFIFDYIHADDNAIFIREFNESIASGNTLRFFYRLKKADGTYVIFESTGHPHLTSEAYGPNSATGFCRGFFMMARPYPTKNASLLDSFLEHKIENERLTKRIAELRREEQEEAEAQQRHWQMKAENGHGSITPSDGQATETETIGSASRASGQSNSYDGMPPPAKPHTSNTALTQQNLDEVNTYSKPDSINDKMARYEGATHIETIEMLTGLRYRDGERSQGISTGDASPALIRGDMGIAMPTDKDTRNQDKKKKLKVADEYVCTDCGTLDSPEWRKGPNGPKTLCNACGCMFSSFSILFPVGGFVVCRVVVMGEGGVGRKCGVESRANMCVQYDGRRKKRKRPGQGGCHRLCRWGLVRVVNKHMTFQEHQMGKRVAQCRYLSGCLRGCRGFFVSSSGLSTTLELEELGLLQIESGGITCQRWGRHVFLAPPCFRRPF
jgi:PAS domain S-box-containing protein